MEEQRRWLRLHETEIIDLGDSTQSPSTITPPPRAEGLPAPTREVIGVLQKETSFGKLGRWQLILWQNRFVYATNDALCYQHVSLGAKVPSGKTCCIPYSAMRNVGVQADDRTILLIQCALRHYVFRFNTHATCELWAAALCAAMGRSKQPEPLNANATVTAAAHKLTNAETQLPLGR